MNDTSKGRSKGSPISEAILCSLADLELDWTALVQSVGSNTSPVSVSSIRLLRSELDKKLLEFETIDPTVRQRLRALVIERQAVRTKEEHRQNQAAEQRRKDEREALEREAKSHTLREVINTLEAERAKHESLHLAAQQQYADPTTPQNRALVVWDAMCRSKTRIAEIDEILGRLRSQMT